MVPFSSQHHSFDISLATEFGIEEAILIHHFQHWIRFNKSTGKNFIEGRTWTYQTQREIQAHFPYMSLETIRYYLDKLIKIKILIVRNFSKDKFQKTYWYAFVDESKFFLNISNNFCEVGKVPHRDGESPTSLNDIYTKIEDTKDIKDKHTYTGAREAEASSLCAFFSSEILKNKPNMNVHFIRRGGEKFFLDLLKTRDLNKLKETIVWFCSHPFWKTRILSIKSMYKNIGMLEMQMKEKEIKQDSKKFSNKNLIKKIRDKYGNSEKIDFSEEYIGFKISPIHYTAVSVDENGFYERILNNMRKIGIHVSDFV